MIFGAVFAFVVPLGIGLLAADPASVACASPGLWGTIPQWVQAIGVPAAILVTVWVAQTTAREARRKELREQLALTDLAYRYGESVTSTLEAAIAAHADYPDRIGREMFESHQYALSKFPVEKVHEVEVALRIHDLAVAIAFFVPRYATLYTSEPESDEAIRAKEKLRGSLRSAIEAKAHLQSLRDSAEKAAARQVGWLDEASFEVAPERTQTRTLASGDRPEMTVAELIDKLSACDPAAQVTLENSEIADVVVDASGWHPSVCLVPAKRDFGRGSYNTEA